MSGSEFFDGVLIRSPWRSSGLVCHFLYRGYGFNTKPQQSFFFHQGKNADLSIKVRKLSWCLLVINKNNLSHLKSLTCPWGRPLLSCQSGNSRHTPWSPCGLEYLPLIKGQAYDHNYKFRAKKLWLFSTLTFLIIYLNCAVSSSSFSFSTSSQGR